MAITFNDGIYNKSPKPLDMKAFVGSKEPRFIFDTKEDIPESYRFLGLTVTEVGDEYKVWRLEGGTSDSNWTELVMGGGASDMESYQHINNAGDTSSFDLPITGYNNKNTLVSVNGITLTKVSDYTITAVPIGINITFSMEGKFFNLEDKDVIQLIKI